MTVTDPPGRRVAVIGDLAGHLEELRAELLRLGAEVGTGRLPPDLVVVQLGDLVHRGPASDGVVALIDRYLTSQPRQWIQLVGNHEAHYLRRAVFDWPERIASESADTLRRWWADGQMRAAAVVRSDSESFLVTHAGLTVDFWRDVLGAPDRAEAAAIRINALIGSREDVLFSAGEMLHGRRKNQLAGPLWAATATELVPGWLTETMPFSQIHGHASIFDWQDRIYRASDAVTRLTSVDEDAKHETIRLEGGRIIGVDPGHGEQPRRPWRAWEMTSGVGLVDQP